MNLHEALKKLFQSTEDLETLKDKFLDLADACDGDDISEDDPRYIRYITSMKEKSVLDYYGSMIPIPEWWDDPI